MLHVLPQANGKLVVAPMLENPHFHSEKGQRESKNYYQTALLSALFNLAHK